MSAYEIPAARKDAFNCPHCGAFSTQHWTQLTADTARGRTRDPRFQVCCCQRCDDVTIWKDDRMIFPFNGSAPMPNQDMPDEIKKDYNEARDIIALSPRSACMLLRLCVQKICNQKVAGTGSLNKKIRSLVKKGLDPQIQQSLDSVRVIGGEAVHPLQMDLRDDIETATSLFGIVNYISDWAYTREKKIKAISEKLPQSAQIAIRKRDSTA